MTTLITDELSPYVVNGALPADMKATYYGLGLVLPQNLKLSKPEDFATWKSYGHHVRQFINSVEEKASKHDENSELLSDYRSLMAWAIGDFLVAGVKGGLKPRVLKRHVREILGNRKSLAWGTISNYMVTCKAIEFSRRRESLSFSHHVEVAKYPPEEQDRYLERAAAVRVSVREFKKMVHELQRQKMTMEERVAQAAKEKPLRLWIEVSEKERDQLREIARAKRM